MLSVNEINLLQAQNEGLKKQNVELQKENAELKAEIETLKSQLDFEVQKKEVLEAENERLKKENEILLGQLVINDGEDITVQISKSQFDEYNKYRQTLQKIKGYLSTLSGIDNDFVNTETYLRILDLITKAESEEE